MSRKKFPYLSCYSSKSVFYLIKILKEICYTMLNLDGVFVSFLKLHVFISIIIFLKNRIPEMLKKELKVVYQ